MDVYVRLPKILFQEFLVLWRQVESIAPTFSHDAQDLIGKVGDTIGKFKTQVRSSECENAGAFKQPLNVLLDFSPQYLFNWGPLKLDTPIIYPQLKSLTNSSFQILQLLTSHPAHQVILINAVSRLYRLMLVHTDQITD